MIKLYLLIFLLLVSSVSALQVQLSTNNFIVIKNETKVYDINITNTESFTIYNVSFSPVSSLIFPSISSMASNETVTKQISVLTTSAFNETFTTTVSYSFFTTTTSQPVTNEVNVEQTVLSPNNLTIRKGDSVRWNNRNPVITYNIKKYDGTESPQPISPNSNLVKEFNSIQVWDYYVMETGLIGKITVIDNVLQALTHDPSEDTQISFTVKSQNEKSNLTIDNLIKDFKIKYTNKEQGALRLVSASAYQVKLTANNDWIVFYQNDFDFRDSKIVTYDVIPRIKTSNETNKSYEIIITALGENTPTVNSSINVFIEYSPQVTINESVLDVPITFATEAQMLAICIKYPDRCRCPILTQNVFIEKNDTVVNALRDMDNKMQRTENREKQREELTGSINTQITELSTKLTATSTTLDDFRKDFADYKRSKSITSFFITFGAILTILGGGIFLGFRFLSNKAKMEGNIFK